MLMLWGDPMYEFPRTREQLYDTYIRYLYRENRERSESVQTKMALDPLKKQLQQLAFQMLLNQASPMVNRTWAEEQVEAEGANGAQVITDAVNLHLMIENEIGEVRFFHQSMYEHLVLPLIDLDTDNAERLKILIDALSSLGTIAQSALPKLVIIYAKYLDTKNYELAGSAFTVFSLIAFRLHDVVRQQKAATQVMALRLIASGLYDWSAMMRRLMDSDRRRHSAVVFASVTALASSISHGDHTLDGKFVVALTDAVSLAASPTSNNAHRLAHNMLRLLADYFSFPPEKATKRPQAFSDHCRRIMGESAEALSRIESMA